MVKVRIAFIPLCNLANEDTDLCNTELDGVGLLSTLKTCYDWTKANT
jgi:hypothetical protein